MQNTNPDLVSLLLDTGHAKFAGANIDEIIQKHGNRIKYVHLKDIRANILEKVRNQNLSFLTSVKDGVFTVPGDGCIDFATIFSQLENLNYSGWFVVEAEQDPAKANPFEYAKKARKFIKDQTGI